MQAEADRILIEDEEHVKDLVTDMTSHYQDEIHRQQLKNVFKMNQK